MIRKNILITGSNQGLGFSLAVKFAKEGFHVIAVSRHMERLQKLALSASNIKCICADITKIEDRNHIFQAINKPISIIHNAAVLQPGPFAYLSEDSLRLQYEVNYFSPLLITQKLLSLLKGQRVLYISSGAVELDLPGLLPYCATKAVMEKTVRGLNAELNSEEIYFSSLRPGMIDTPMQAQLRNTSEENLPHRQFYIDAKQLNQLACPDEVAEFVFWVITKTDNQTFSHTTWDFRTRSRGVL